MSYGVRTLFLLSLTLAFAALLDQAAAAREFPMRFSNTDKKQPEWLLDPDGSLLIPGIGRVMVPPKFRPLLPHMPHYGGGGSTMMPPMMSPPLGGSGSASPPLGGGSGMSPPAGGGSHIPGGDDTFVPNPRVEVPNPSGGRIPAPSRP